MKAVAPKIQQVQDTLRRELRQNCWQVGDRLPSDAELAQRFDCGVGTIGRALALLAHDGWVERRTRVGTRVLRTGAAQSGVALEACAFIYPSTQHEGIWKMAQGFQEAARRDGRRVVMLSTQSDYEKEAEYVSRLSEFDVCGAVTCPNLTTPQELAAFAQILVSSKFPVVLGGTNFSGLGCSAVTVDRFHAGYTMTRELLAQGLRRIGFFGCLSWVGPGYEAYRGYCWALDEAGVSGRTDWQSLEPSTVTDFDDPVRESIDLGRRFLERNGSLEGVVAASDFNALGLMSAAQERGVRVPQDLKITGMDDYALARDGAIPLTTYRIPYIEIGRRSYALMQERMRLPDIAARVESVRGEVVRRASA